MQTTLKPNFLSKISTITILLSLASTSFAEAPMIVAGTTEKISDSVYIIPDKRVSLVPNIGFIVGDNSVMVIDTGMGPRNAEIVLQEVRKVTDKPIDYLAITHFHPEHGMGAQSFPNETKIVVPQAQKQELDAKGEAYIELFKGFGPDIAGLLEDVKLVTPHLAFDTKMEIDLGGLKVQLLHFETAHTQGDMFVYLPEQKLLFGGDIIINRFFPITPDADSNANGWINTLQELKALKPKVVVPGHGAVSDASLIDDILVYLKDQKSRVNKAKKQGLSLEQTQEKLAPIFEKEYKDWGEPFWIKNSIERFYIEG